MVASTSANTNNNDKSGLGISDGQTSLGRDVNAHNNAPRVLRPEQYSRLTKEVVQASLGSPKTTALGGIVGVEGGGGNGNNNVNVGNSGSGNIGAGAGDGSIGIGASMPGQLRRLRSRTGSLEQLTSLNNTPRNITPPGVSSMGILSMGMGSAASTTAQGLLPLPSASVHPPIDNVNELDEYIRKDPACLVQVLPEILHTVERYVVANPHPNVELGVWEKLRPLLELATGIRSLEDSDGTSESAAGNAQRPSSPECPPKEDTSVNSHGEEWADEYSWLKDKSNSDVLKYIDSENSYTSEIMTHTKPLQKLLYKEFVSRLDEGEESARIAMPDGYTYFSRKVVGQEYRQHVRVNTETGQEEVYLDENKVSNSEQFADAGYFNVGFIRFSPDGKTVAYGVDESGNERYTAFFMDMETKTLLPDRVGDIYEYFEWSSCNHAYYLLLDSSERAYKLMRHVVGTPTDEDVLIYHEEDESYYLELSKTCNGRFIILNSAAQVTSETRYIPCFPNSSVAERCNLGATDNLNLLFPRRENINYRVESHGGFFYILTNENSKNNWIYRVPVPETLRSSLGGPKNWEQILAMRETVIEHRDFVLIEDYTVRERHLIVFERSNCLQNVRIMDLRESGDGRGFNTYHYISFSDPVYSLWPGTVAEEGDLIKAVVFDTNILRLTVSSLVTPKQVVDYDMESRVMTVIHEERVNGFGVTYDPSRYVQKRLYATSVDGTSVPMSLVYRMDLIRGDGGHPVNGEPGGGNPCLLYGYGAYGSSTDPVFSKVRLSLLDRGFVFAIAHVRGGSELGNGWYEEGKLLKKPNTFLDFISCAEYLINEGYTSPSKLAAYGRSAGGLLVGASITMRPDLFKAALMEVPFVDVVNTMSDPSIPWTAFEYEEWGNPADSSIYRTMKSYCPYTQLTRLGPSLARGEFPDLLVVGGMNDPRVAFFEPLKFVARARRVRRAERTANLKDESRSQLSGNAKRESIILLKVDDVGHGGSSGQYSYLEDLAFEYAFLIDRVGGGFRPTLPPGSSTVSTPYGLGYTTEDLKKETEMDMKNLGKKKGEHVEEEFRGNKGRRRNKVYQWLSNFF